MKKIINPWDKFWKLSIVKEVDKKWKHRYFLCECECWNKKEIILDSLIYWKSKSCWCYNLEVRKRKKPELRKYWTNIICRKNKLYNVFSWIKSRCNNPKNKSYKNYWWRWIKCEWKNFWDFLRDMWEMYKEWLQIDRIDVNWNYCKENCRWVTNKENCNNRRNSIKYMWLSIEELWKILWLGYSCLYSRYKRHNNLFYKRPTENVTREECAAMIWRLYEKINTNP